MSLETKPTNQLELEENKCAQLVSVVGDTLQKVMVIGRVLLGSCGQGLNGGQ